MITLVLGGAKSGKTKWALKYGESLKEFKELYYLATAQALDEEMKEKIEKHKRERSSLWKLIEEPLNLVDPLKKLASSPSVILVDCLTLWVSNLIFYKKDIEKEITTFLQVLKENFQKNAKNWTILVSNEVGLGIVPENNLARRYRDRVGILNQEVAILADEVYFIIAGLTLPLSSSFSIGKFRGCI